MEKRDKFLIKLKSHINNRVNSGFFKEIQEEIDILQSRDYSYCDERYETQYYDDEDLHYIQQRVQSDIMDFLMERIPDRAWKKYSLDEKDLERIAYSVY
jgi:hypothetical protein